MRRRSSVITFNQTDSVPPPNWQQQSITDNRKMSSASIQSNISNNSPNKNSDTSNFLYQQPQLMRYTTVFIYLCIKYNFCIYITDAFFVSLSN